MEIRSDARDAFLRFRERGDSAALAEVFDLVAQELLLVASHVASRQQQPEDLLQETFLVAIQRAERYDADRPLEPWLIGILVNVTRNDRRRRQREVTGAAVEPQPYGSQPSESAIEGEFVELLREAIAGLPVPQREVMTLNLVHGMTPTEIAHATSRPVGTVKSWIHRSLERVRRRLPAGLVGALGNVLRGMGAMARVRERVCEAAAQAVAAGLVTTGGSAVAATSASAGSSGWRFGRWGLRVPLLAAVLAVPIAWHLLGDAPPPPAPPTENETVAASTNPDEPVQSPVRQEAAPVVAVAEPASSDNTCTLEIVGDFRERPFAWHGYVVSLLLSDPVLRSVHFTTNDEGSYTFLKVPFGSYQLQPNRGDVLDVRVDRPELTVRVPLHEGVDVAGRVVDGRGHGVAGARIWQTIEGTLRSRLPIATSDADGSFRVPVATSGRYLTASADGMRPSQLRQVPETPSDAPLVLTLGERAGFVDFEVVNERGQPVQGAALQIGDSMVGPPSVANDKTRQLRQPWMAISDGQGRAVCAELPLDRSLRLFARAPGTAPFALTIAPQEERQTVRVQLTPGATCSGVVSSAGGEGIAAVTRAIRIGSFADYRTPGWFWPSCLTDVDGKYSLWGVPIGDVLLQARSSGTETAESERAVAAGERLTWSPVIGRGGRVHGRVATADGRPLAGHFVRASAVACRSFFAPVDEEGSFDLRDLPDRRFELSVIPAQDRVGLVLLRRNGVRIGSELELTVPAENAPTAMLRGRIAQLDVREVGLFQRLSGQRYTAEVAADGSFVFPRVVAGSYHLMAGMVEILLRRDVELKPSDVQDLGVVDTVPRTPLRVRFEQAPAELYVYTDDCGPMISYARLGEQPKELMLPPGPYRLLVGRSDRIVFSRRIVIEAEPVELSLSAEVGQDIWLSALPSTPSVSLRVVFDIEGPGFGDDICEPADVRRFLASRPRTSAASDSAGLVVSLPDGEYRVRALAADGTTATTVLKLPLAPGQRLPAMQLR